MSIIPDEILAQIKAILKFSERDEKNEVSFIKVLTPKLVEVVFEFEPRLYEKRKVYEGEIKEISQRFAKELFAEYFIAFVANGVHLEIPELAPVKKPQSKEEASEALEKELEALIEKYDYPIECQEGYRRAFWNQYSSHYKQQLFKYTVYEEVKKTFSFFCTEGLLDLESDYLRFFDRALYAKICVEYIDAIRAFIIDRV